MGCHAFATLKFDAEKYIQSGCPYRPPKVALEYTGSFKVGSGQSFRSLYLVSFPFRAKKIIPREGGAKRLSWERRTRDVYLRLQLSHV